MCVFVSARWMYTALLLESQLLLGMQSTLEIPFCCELLCNMDVEEVGMRQS